MLRLHGHHAPSVGANRAGDPPPELRAHGGAVAAGRERARARDSAIAINAEASAPRDGSAGWGSGTASAGERRGVRRRHFLA